MMVNHTSKQTLEPNSAVSFLNKPTEQRGFQLDSAQRLSQEIQHKLFKNRFMACWSLVTYSSSAQVLQSGQSIKALFKQTKVPAEQILW